ncbi:glycosyltransferase family 2 protein [Candidatus Peregrinibacteria bacterium]|nr:glycosyltransferase family 2 protein [Candidatus Peregrinibacteria bacterium]
MVSLVIINYNGEKLLKECLDSIFALDYKEPEVIFIDNASTDGSVKFVVAHYPKVRVFANKNNSGYAGAANQAIEVSGGEFLMLLNPDIVFEKDYVKILVRRLKEDEKIGAIIGKLRKYDFASPDRAKSKTKLIDSAGLVMYRNRRCVDRGQGEEDFGQFDLAQEVFGVTGACPLYRKKALLDCKVRGEIFDNGFFMYKEDVDISWRLRLFGWKCFYEPAALVYHGRGTGVFNRSTALEVAKNRSGLSEFQRYFSYKNERLMRVKNEMWPNVAHDFFPIIWKEILMFGWAILREQFLFKSFGKFLLQLPGALLKRREIMRRKIAPASQMQKWFAR